MVTLFAVLTCGTRLFDQSRVPPLGLRARITNMDEDEAEFQAVSCGWACATIHPLTRTTRRRWHRPPRCLWARWSPPRHRPVM